MFSKVSQNQNVQNQDQGQSQQANNQPEAAKPQTLKPEEQEEQLKKFSKCMSAYGMAMINMQSQGGNIGVETCGSCG